MKKATEAQRERAKENRTNLLKLVNELVQIEKSVNPSFESKGNINPLLISYYETETGCSEFKTFKGWKEAGYMVRKGEHGYPIFSRPIDKIKEEKGVTPSESDAGRFGTCYIFASNQVEPIK